MSPAQRKLKTETGAIKGEIVDIPEGFLDEIVAFVKKNNLTNAQVSNLTGLSVSYVSKLFNGIHNSKMGELNIQKLRNLMKTYCGNYEKEVKGKQTEELMNRLVQAFNKATTQDRRMIVDLAERIVRGNDAEEKLRCFKLKIEQIQTM